MVEESSNVDPRTDQTCIVLGDSAHQAVPIKTQISKSKETDFGMAPGKDTTQITTQAEFTEKTILGHSAADLDSDLNSSAEADPQLAQTLVGERDPKLDEATLISHPPSSHPDMGPGTVL